MQIEGGKAFRKKNTIMYASDILDTLTSFNFEFQIYLILKLRNFDDDIQKRIKSDVLLQFHGLCALYAACDVFQDIVNTNKMRANLPVKGIANSTHKKNC